MGRGGGEKVGCVYIEVQRLPPLLKLRSDFGDSKKVFGDSKQLLMYLFTCDTQTHESTDCCWLCIGIVPDQHDCIALAFCSAWSRTHD